MSNEQVLRSIPEIGLEFPSDPLMAAAFEYAQKYCPVEVYKHVARTAYWALILAKKLPVFSTSQVAASRTVNLDEVIFICLLHDMGLTTWLLESSDNQEADSNPFPGLLTLDKRFEVDGANIARAFMAKAAADKKEWDDARLDRIWTAIALHSSPSIAKHAPAPEIALAQLAIEADFFGPYLSHTGHHSSPAPTASSNGGTTHPQKKEQSLITPEEYRAVTALFPRGDFNCEGVKRTLCTLCRRKPNTTFDNMTGVFGKEYGMDGQGAGKEEFKQQWETRQSPMLLLQVLDKLVPFDTKE